MPVLKRSSRLRLLEGSDLLIIGVEDVGGDGVFEVHVVRVARGHQVLVVDELDEGLHARLLGRVLLYDHARVLLYPCNQTVTVGALARVARGHQVAVVDNLDEGLRGLLGGVLLYHHARVLLYPCNQTVTVGALARALIEGLHYHRLRLPLLTGNQKLETLHLLVQIQG